MQPIHTAWLVFLIPLVAVHASWLWSSVVGAIEWCLPYWSGCTSISRAARSSDALFLFRAAMLVNATLLAIYWLQAGGFLSIHSSSPLDGKRRQIRWMQTAGITGAVFLVLYVDFLGTTGHVYQLLRRYGVTLYFSLTLLAQLLFLRQLLLINGNPVAARWINAKTWLCWWLLAVGLASILGNALLTDPAKDRWENIIEWHFALAMNTYFIFTAILWKQSGYRQLPMRN
ncbi:MAG TPA: hypothetical protein VLE50_02220 [Cellvibrio sp.]|nr:hypothetical protein [Cellvibrio sp.]